MAIHPLTKLEGAELAEREIVSTEAVGTIFDRSRSPSDLVHDRDEVAEEECNSIPDEIEREAGVPREHHQRDRGGNKGASSDDSCADEGEGPATTTYLDGAVGGVTERGADDDKSGDPDDREHLHSFPTESVLGIERKTGVLCE